MPGFVNPEKGGGVPRAWLDDGGQSVLENWV